MQNVLYLLKDILLPQFDYNTRIVMFGIVVYSVGSGLLGNFMLLQRKSLLADVLSHATFPGVVSLFMIMISIGFFTLSKSLLILVIGAIISTVIALLLIVFLQKNTILKEDAVQALILSVFFGGGVVLLGIAQRMPGGSAAGIMSFIYGQTASLQKNDALLFLAMSLFLIAFIFIKKRDLTILCFDREFAYSMGLRITRLEFMLLMLVLLQVVIGIQAIGLLMVSALLIIPVVIARFWSEKINNLLLISVIVGAVSGYLGALLSANSVRLPTGAVIVAVMEVFFVGSLLFGTKRGIVTKYMEQQRFVKKIRIEHILRIMYEYLDVQKEKENIRVPFEYMLSQQSLSRFQLQQTLKKMEYKEYITIRIDGIEISHKGNVEAKKVLRNHRLWEAYLLYYADASPDTVDYSADKVEHILGDEFTHELEELIASTVSDVPLKPVILPSPHALYSDKEERTT